MMSGISAFFAWWGSELMGLIPGAGRSSPDQQAARTVLGVEPDGLRLIETPARKSDPRPEGIVPAPAMLAYLASRTRVRSHTVGSVGLRLPYSACFVRNLELPALARRDFGRLLMIDLERSTPFKAKDVLTAHEVDPGPAAKGMVKVRHLIMKRKLIDPLKSGIEALGLTVTRVECTDASGQSVLPVNFLAPALEAANAPVRTNPLAWLLALAAAGLTASAAYVYVDRHEQALHSIEAETAKLKVKAQAQKDALTKTESAFVEIANYQKLRSEAVSKVAALEELTRLLPDTAWVSDVKIEGNTLDISGLAVSAAALVPLLERSKLFYDASSTASLTFDPREEKERFSIRARIRNAAIEAAPSAATVEAAP